MNAVQGINYHFICGYGHGGATSFEACTGSLNRSDMDNLNNPVRTEILYLTHCETMEYQKDCVAERFIHAANGGVTVLGNSHFGWAGRAVYAGTVERQEGLALSLSLSICDFCGKHYAVNL